MPYKNSIDKKKHNKKYYKIWYAKNGRIRAFDYQEAINEWTKNHPIECKAREKVNNAIKTGKLLKPFKCEECGRITRLSGHHINYKKELEVQWLCSSCHKLKHILNHSS